MHFLRFPPEVRNLIYKKLSSSNGRALFSTCKQLRREGPSFKARFVLDSRDNYSLPSKSHATSAIQNLLIGISTCEEGVSNLPDFGGLIKYFGGQEVIRERCDIVLNTTMIWLPRLESRPLKRCMLSFVCNVLGFTTATLKQDKTDPVKMLYQPLGQLTGFREVMVELWGQYNNNHPPDNLELQKLRLALEPTLGPSTYDTSEGLPAFRFHPVDFTQTSLTRS